MYPTLTQGQQFQGGIVNFDANTGQRLATGQTTTFNPQFNPAFSQNTSVVNTPSPAINVNAPINPNTLTGQPLQIQQTQVPNANNANAFVAGVTASQPSVMDYYNQLAPVQNSQVQQQATSLTDRLSSLIGLNTGRTAATQSAENAAGVNNIRQNITDLNGTIATKLAEYNAKQAALGTTPMSFAASSGYEAAINNQKASEIGLLQAQTLAQSGQLTNALDMAKRAVDLQYGPIEEEIAAKEAQLKLLQPELTKEEKRQSDAQSLYLQDQKDKIAEEKANKKGVQDLIINASSQAAPANLIQKASQASTPSEAAAILGVYAGDALGRQVKLSSLETDKAQRDNIYSQINERGTKAKSKVVSPVQAQTSAKNQIDTISALLSNTKGLKAAVGTTGLFGRGGNVDFGSSKQEFNSTVQQLTSQLTLDKLVNAKANGATFGALSEGELNLLQGGATKLNTWAIKDKDGNITGFKTSEKNVIKELNSISAFAKKDFILKGGDPSTVGAQALPDGTVWITNSDGTLTQLN